MRNRSVSMRAGAVVAGAAVALLAGALPASADKASGDLNGGTDGYKVDVGSGKLNNLRTSLMNLELDSGNTLNVYCVEIKVGAQHERKMVEQPWDEYPNEASPFNDNRAKINWILHNGYPYVEAAALGSAVAESGAELHDGLNKEEAITATQAAIWHFSDDVELNRDNPLPNSNWEKVEADVVAVYDYLTGDANTGLGEQPTPALEVSPESVSGETGSRLGPFTVSTNGEITELTSDLPEGATLTDAEGNELTAGDVTDGTEIFVDVPAELAEGKGGFELTALSELDTGRLFIAEGYHDDPAQSLIVADSEETELTAGATTEWKAGAAPTTPPEETSTTTAPPSSAETTAPPTSEATPAPQADDDDLAQTGFSALTPILIGAGLVVAGTGALLLQRRRKNTA